MIDFQVKAAPVRSTPFSWPEMPVPSVSRASRRDSYNFNIWTSELCYPEGREDNFRVNGLAGPGFVKEMDIENKLQRLNKTLDGMGSLLVAYSGGVDSTLLAVLAYQVLGHRMLAVFAASPLEPPEVQDEAAALAKIIGFKFMLIQSAVMDDADFISNPPDRCYYCRMELFKDLSLIAGSQEIQWIADGAIMDDLDDYRPGRRAARENAVRSPLQEAGFTKSEVRALSQKMGLPNWNKPSSPCLASRIPYGIAVTRNILDRIARGEKALREYGLTQFRFRHHGDVARIEVLANEMPLIMNNRVRDDLAEKIKSLGYHYAALDLSGFRSGSLNEVLKKDTEPPEN